MNKKRENIIRSVILIIITFLTILSIMLLQPISNMDELWNYNFARNIADGLLPYKDFNMVTMPLLSFVCAIFLKLILNEVIVMRILAAILSTTIIFFIYKIFILLKIEEKFSFLLSLWITLLLRNMLCIDYNWATLLIVLLIILIEIKNLKRNQYEQFRLNLKTDFFIGVLSGLSILLKQTTGITICAVALGYKLLLIKNTDDFKAYLKILASRILGPIIVLSIFIVYLLVTNSYMDWFQYTIMGIKYFDNYISYTKLFSYRIGIKILAIVVPIMYMYLYVKTILLEAKQDTDKNLFILFVYSLSICILIYPIADPVHFMIASVPVLISAIYTIYLFIIEKSGIKFNTKQLKIKEFILYMLEAITTLILISYSICNIIMYKQAENKSNLEHYKYIKIDENLENRIIKLDKYILQEEKKEHKVYILDSYACLYMIPINRYNKDYDLFNKGNLGDNETEKIILRLNSEKNTRILIRNDNKFNWQTPMNIIDYVRQNFKLIRKH